MATLTPEKVLVGMGISIDELSLPLGAVGALSCIISWFLEPAGDQCKNSGSVQSAINTTNRVTIWAIVAFAAYQFIAINSPVPLTTIMPKHLNRWYPVDWKCTGEHPALASAQNSNQRR
ncbi:MAG: hypothetical protein HOI23_07595 [Deltaproteobacteria bacterium]|jgi:hypothetical protein|nr:hypothetical protein [Deltaproteobacteria bacterium]MBT6432150.1 hypothetical protein [Deltaproteobacteria bacterium]MBT6490112.1 hypothetical protein [Deltaproteobacteria bacterium]